VLAKLQEQQDLVLAELQEQQKLALADLQILREYWLRRSRLGEGEIVISQLVRLQEELQILGEEWLTIQKRGGLWPKEPSEQLLKDLQEHQELLLGELHTLREQQKIWPDDLQRLFVQRRIWLDELHVLRERRLKIRPEKPPEKP
jgi:hypothetical protein